MKKIYYFLFCFLFFQQSWASDLIQLTASVDQTFTNDTKSWSHGINESGDYQIGEAWIEASHGSDVTLKIYKNDTELLKSMKAPEGELMFFESRVEDLVAGDRLTIQVTPNGGTYRMGYKIACATPDFKGLAVFNVHDAAYGAVGDGSTDDFPAIQAAVNAAIQVGGGIVRFDGSKIYRAIGSKSLDIENLIDIKNAKNIKIEGNGATILLHPPDRLVSINQSENIQIDGLVMNYDPIPYYQGKIDNINITNKTIDITVPNRYEAPKVGDSPSKINAFFAFSFMPNSPDSRLGTGKHIHISKTENISGDPRKVRLSVKDQSWNSLQYSIDHNATEMVVPDIDYGHRGMFSIEVLESSRVTVSNLLCKMMPHMGIQPENNIGPITFTNVDLLMENPETELYWSWRGAYSVTGNNRWGFLIEDGEWHGNAMYDDILAFYTRRQEVLKITDHSLSLDPGVYTDFSNLYKVGDWVSIWTKDQEILRGFSRVVSLGEKQPMSFDISFDSLPEGVSIDDVVINESLYNRGTVVRNCKNIPVGASDASTRIRTGGHFKDCDFNGLYLITEFDEVYKPVRCRNLIVENCVFGQTENKRVRLTSSINPRFINCTFDNTYIYGDKKARDIFLQNSTWVNMDDEVISLTNSKDVDKNSAWVFGGATRNGISENLSNYVKIAGNSIVKYAIPPGVNGYYSLQAIANNVELLANNDFSNSNLFANQASLSADNTPGKWFAGNVEQFTTSIAKGVFECASVAGGTLNDYFLGQITSDARVNTGRYRFSIKASGNQPFYIKISSVYALGTELGYALNNASASAIEKQASPDYAGYSLKITPNGTSATYSADLDLRNAIPSAVRIYIVFPKVGNVTVDDVSFMRTTDVPGNTTFYVRPASDNTSWTSLTDIDPDQIVTSNSPTINGTNTYYFAKGNYTMAGVTVTTGKIYGGFSGNETSINLSHRELSDKDGNGIVEPWEMTNETVINGTNPISGGETNTRLITVTGGEINGLTLQNHHCSNSGAVLLGIVTSAPTADQDIYEYAGKMIYCSVRKIKSTANAPIMSTNKASQIDYCLIEECSSTSTSIGATGAIFFNAVGGRLSNSVIRNNQAIAAGTNTRGGAIRSTTTSGDMNVIIENCVIYNNTSGGGGGAIRSDGVASRRGAQIINCTVVNNKTTTATNTGSVDLVNGGLIVNSIVVDDPQHEIRANTTNNYISNNAYGTYTGSAAYPNTNMAPGKTAVDFNFTSYSTNVGAMQPDDVGFDQATYDAIRASNFKITASASAAVTTPGLKNLPSNYLIGGTGASVALTATIPTTDITGIARNPACNYDLGAYQFSVPLTALTNDNEISKLAIFAFKNEIIVSNLKGASIAVYSVTGQLLKSITANSDRVSITSDMGVYIVKAGAKVAKVLLK